MSGTPEVPTPRTDAAFTTVRGQEDTCEYIDRVSSFARELEREVVALTAKLAVTSKPHDADVESTINKFAEAFLGWPLPHSVCADRCATEQMKGRVGTNLLSCVEARQMFSDLVAPELIAMRETIEGQRVCIEQDEAKVAALEKELAETTERAEGRREVNYLLSQEEFDALKAKQTALKGADTQKLQDFCTRVANEMPVKWGWSANEEPKPWRCILTVKGDWYCDSCPAREFCPNPMKEYSK